MARSVFARLSRRFGHSANAVTRRGFLKASLAATSGLLLSDLAGCSTDQGGQFRPAADAKHIAIIGAGFAGLACGYELMSAGYRVTLVDPRSRVGGRVFSSQSLVPGKNVELGGELIGSNHPMWVAYKEKFGLEFIDVTEDETLEMPIILGGKSLDEKQAEAMWEEMDAAFATLNKLAEPIDADQPWLSPEGPVIDATPLSDWWRKLEVSDITRVALKAQLASDNAVELEQQSTLAMLASIKGGGGEAYWTESEVYRCNGGNQQLATKLASAIGMQNIRLKRAATSIKESATGVTITCSDGSQILADEVVLAVPPSVWSKITIDPALPDAIKPQMGIAVKHLSALKSRFWKEKGQSPDSLTDGAISQTWEATDNQPGDSGAALVAFSGGDVAKSDRSHKSKDALNDHYRKTLEARYPGYSEQLITTMMMDWPGDPWTLGGYSFPAPGQVMSAGKTLRDGRGKMHFAGEHTCFKFVGYMEGGLSSGAELAKRMAVRDGVIKG